MSAESSSIGDPMSPLSQILLDIFNGKVEQATLPERLPEDTKVLGILGHPAACRLYEKITDIDKAMGIKRDLFDLAVVEADMGIGAMPDQKKHQEEIGKVMYVRKVLLVILQYAAEAMYPELIGRQYTFDAGRIVVSKSTEFADVQLQVSHPALKVFEQMAEIFKINMDGVYTLDTLEYPTASERTIGQIQSKLTRGIIDLREELRGHAMAEKPDELKNKAYYDFEAHVKWENTQTLGRLKEIQLSQITYRQRIKFLTELAWVMTQEEFPDMKNPAVGLVIRIRKGGYVTKAVDRRI